MPYLTVTDKLLFIVIKATFIQAVARMFALHNCSSAVHFFAMFAF